METNIIYQDINLPYIELRHTKESNKHYRPHRHDGFSIGAIYEGRAIFYGALNIQIPLKKYTLVLLNPETIHACNPKQNTKRSFFILYFEKDWILKFQQSIFGNTENFIPVNKIFLKDKKLFFNFLSLCNAILDKNILTLKKEELIEEFMKKIFIDNCNINSKNKNIEFKNTHINKIKEFLKKNVTKNPSILQIATELNLSPAHIIRNFKYNVGITPHTYLINLKIEYAKKLLNSNLSIAEVAYEVGLSDQSHLNRLFKQYVACTPGEYKKSLY